VGSKASDGVGAYGMITALNNGHFISTAEIACLKNNQNGY
jgi:hypothetical protein